MGHVGYSGDPEKPLFLSQEAWCLAIVSGKILGTFNFSRWKGDGKTLTVEHLSPQDSGARSEVSLNEHLLCARCCSRY